MLDITDLDVEDIWKIVNDVRKSFLYKYGVDNVHKNCKDSNTLISDEYIKENVDTVNEKLKLAITSTPNKNITYETLVNAKNIFTYLNVCPTTGLNAFFDMRKKSESAKNILLALTSIMKTSQNAVQKSSTKIFLKAMAVLELRNFEIIFGMTNGEVIEACRKYSLNCNETLKVLGNYHHY